jgi:hypothetical protein
MNPAGVFLFVAFVRWQRNSFFGVNTALSAAAGRGWFNSRRTRMAARISRRSAGSIS